MIGFGSIGKGTLPLIERHFDYDKTRFVVIDPEDKDRKRCCDKHGVRFIQQAVTKDNYRELLTPLLTEGGGQGFCVNLSVDTSSVDIMELCSEIGALYIDTVNEPWLGFYFDKSKGAGGALELRAARNDARRQEGAQARLRRRPCPAAAPIPAWSPGSSSRRCSTSRADLKLNVPEPKTRDRMGRPDAPELGVKGIHIAERDTQRSKKPKPPEVFVNTWSVEGFLSEGMQPAELGWGTHEKWMPANAHTHKTGCRRGDLPDAARRQHARAHLVPDARRAIRLPRHPQRVDLDRRLFHGARRSRHGRSTGRPATTPITRRRRGAVAARDVRLRQDAGEASTSSTRTRSSTASTSSACCSTATARTPTGSARSSRSRRRASLRLTRTPPACR